MTEVHSSTGTGGAGDQATGNAQEAAGQAREKAQEVAGQAQEKAQEAAGQAKNRLAGEVDTRSTQAGEQLRSTAGDARSVAEELRKQGKDKPAELAEKAAEQTQRLGDYLHGSDGQRILRDVEDFGRSKPWALAAGGLALGFAASRLLKASSSRRYQASSDGARTPDRQQALPPGGGTPSMGSPASAPALDNVR